MQIKKCVMITKKDEKEEEEEQQEKEESWDRDETRATQRLRRKQQSRPELNLATGNRKCGVC